MAELKLHIDLGSQTDAMIEFEKASHAACEAAKRLDDAIEILEASMKKIKALRNEEIAFQE